MTKTTSNSLKHVQRGAIATALLMILGAFIFFREYSIVLGVTLGSLIAISNFWVLQRVVTRMMTHDNSGLRGGFAIFLKLVLLMAISALCILKFGVNGLAFATGFSSLLLGILFASFV